MNDYPPATPLTSFLEGTARAVVRISDPESMQTNTTFPRPRSVSAETTAGLKAPSGAGVSFDVMSETPTPITDAAADEVIYSGFTARHLIETSRKLERQRDMAVAALTEALIPLASIKLTAEIKPYRELGPELMKGIIKGHDACLLAIKQGTDGVSSTLAEFLDQTKLPAPLITLAKEPSARKEAP